MSVVVVLTTISAAKAKPLARTLVKAHVAACVNIVPKMVSVYAYKEQIHEEDEALLIIKTSPEKSESLCTMLEVEHPYDVPEILSFEGDASRGYEKFVRDWVHP